MQLSKCLWRSELAAMSFTLAFSALVSVGLAGFNSKLFFPLDLIKLELMLWLLLAIPGLVLGLIAGISAYLAGLVPGLRPLQPRLPWIFFSVGNLGVTIFIIENARALITPAALLFPAVLFSVVLVAVAALAMPMIRDRAQAGLILDLCLLLLMVTVLPLGLAKRHRIGKPNILSAAGKFQPTGFKVILLAIDGMENKIVDQLMAEGKMPNLQQLVEQGARSPLATLKPTLSPQIWTTIVTGKAPEEHRIMHYTTRTIPFTEVQSGSLVIPRHTGLNDFKKHIREGAWAQPISSSNRMEKALWNIFSEYDIRSGVIHWWATWPAENISGIMVSDRVIYYRPQVKDGVELPAAGLTSPPALAWTLGSLVLSPDKVTDEVYRRYMDVSSEEISRMRNASYKKLAIASEFPFSISWDESIKNISLYLIPRHPEISFWAIYTRGIDILSHSALQYSRRMEEPAVSEKKIKKYGRIIDEVYRDNDQFIGEILKFKDVNTIVLVASDHGFRKGKKGEYNHTNAPPGILVMAGGPVKKGASINQASVYDLTPNILYLMGLPVAEDMSGRVWLEAYDPDFVKSRPVKTISTYGPYEPMKEQKTDPNMDKEIKQHLRALGYIK